MTPRDRREFSAWLQAQLDRLDDPARFPDVHEIREMARAILLEHLRELRGEEQQPPRDRRGQSLPRAG